MKLVLSPFFLALTILIVASTLLVVTGSLQYGGIDGLVRRVETEMARYKPHEAFVPTPLSQNNPRVVIKPLPTATPTISESVVLLPTATPLSATMLRDTPVHSSTQPINLNVPSILPTAMVQAPHARVELPGIRHEWQTWNNCGPATLSFYLSYYGSQLSQEDTGRQLRHHEDDKNVSPDELADFSRAAGYVATVRVNGTADLMRTFLSNGFPVLIETWLEEEPNDGMGHYRLLTGYDDAGGYWIAYDSYITRSLINPEADYRGIRLDYAEMDALWKVFNRTYLLVYPQEKQPLVQAIFGDTLSDSNMSQTAALEQAKAEIAANPMDAFAWFNLGAIQLNFGDAEAAAEAFDEARRLGLPWRMLWYQYQPFAAYYRTGRYEEVIVLADATMRNVSTIEDLYYWKGEALAAQGRLAEAEEQWQRALSLNPGFRSAQEALSRAK